MISREIGHVSIFSISSLIGGGRRAAFFDSSSAMMLLLFVIKCVVNQQLLASDYVQQSRVHRELIKVTLSRGTLEETLHSNDDEIFW